MLFGKKEEVQKKNNHSKGFTAPLQNSTAITGQQSVIQENTFYQRVSCCTSGSLTIEAAVILPLFLLAFVLLISVTDLYRYQSLMVNAMQDRVKELGIYAYTNQEENPLSDTLCVTTAGKYIPKEVKKNGSLLWIGSGYHKDYVDLRGSYSWKPPVTFAGVGTIKIALHSRARAWIGSDAALEEADAETAEKMVFVTENGTVYHKYADCSYLDLTIVQTTHSKVNAQRNKNGGKYYPCEKCAGHGAGNTLYITLYGERYHTDPLCSGLKRSVRLVPESETEGMCLCSRCAGRNG